MEMEVKGQCEKIPGASFTEKGGIPIGKEIEFLNISSRSVCRSVPVLLGCQGKAINQTELISNRNPDMQRKEHGAAHCE